MVNPVGVSEATSPPGQFDQTQLVHANGTTVFVLNVAQGSLMNEPKVEGKMEASGMLELNVSVHPIDVHVRVCPPS